MESAVGLFKPILSNIFLLNNNVNVMHLKWNASYKQSRNRNTSLKSEHWMCVYIRVFSLLFLFSTMFDSTTMHESKTWTHMCFIFVFRLICLCVCTVQSAVRIQHLIFVFFFGKRPYAKKRKPIKKQNYEMHQFTNAFVCVILSIRFICQILSKHKQSPVGHSVFSIPKFLWSKKQEKIGRLKILHILRTCVDLHQRFLSSETRRKTICSKKKNVRKKKQELFFKFVRIRSNFFLFSISSVIRTMVHFREFVTIELSLVDYYFFKCSI